MTSFSESGDNISDVSSIVANLNMNRNLHFVVDLSRCSFAQKKSLELGKLELAMKKLAAYADRVILVYGQIEEYTNMPKNVSYYNPAQVIAESSNLPREFNDIFYLLPSVVSTGSYYEDVDEEGNGRFDGVVSFSFYSVYRAKRSYSVSFNDPVMKNNFLEHSPKTSVLNIWLPRVTNIPLDTFLQLRADNVDSFQRYQAAIANFLDRTSKADSESALCELFEHVDYECRRFAEKMKNIRRSRVLSSLELLVGSCALGLSFLVDSDFAKLLTSFYGIYQGKDYITSLIKYNEMKHDLQVSDFYVSWLIDEKNKKQR